MHKSLSLVSCQVSASAKRGLERRGCQILSQKSSQNKGTKPGHASSIGVIGKFLTPQNRLIDGNIWRDSGTPFSLPAPFGSEKKTNKEKNTETKYPQEATFEEPVKRHSCNRILQIGSETKQNKQ